MRLLIINDTGAPIDEELNALREVAAELSVTLSDDGTPVRLQLCNEGLAISAEGDGYTLAYSSRTALLRGFGLVVQALDSHAFSLEEKPAYQMLGLSADCSRNAVLRVETVKQLCRILALMGYNSLLLYTEDTFEIAEHPYFGYMRGRYSAAELQECDRYAALLGIELIPCIQTLAHLPMALRWPDLSSLRDIGDILLVDDEGTYRLIEDMLASMSKNLRSRNIQIGMDEAHLLGLGEYLRRHGYQNRTQIMLRHLKRVVELCKKYGYTQPLMASDMFFRLTNPDYYHLDTQISDEVVAMVPPEVGLIYWDYYHTDEAVYDAMLEKHARFHNRVVFAGGAWNWQGPIPLQRFSMETSAAAIRSLKKHAVKDVLLTTWGDDGGTGSVFSVLPTIQMYAEACWRGDVSNEHLAERLQMCTGMELEGAISMECPHFVPGRAADEISPKNSTGYMLYQDILHGLFDRHIPSGTAEHFADCARKLAAAKVQSPKWEYLFDAIHDLCRVLEMKADLGVRLKQAYDSGDRETLNDIANRQIPELLIRMETLHRSMVRQWMAENKVFGADILDIRMGALKERVQRAARRLNDYLNGEISVVEELEVDRLFFDGRPDDFTGDLSMYSPGWAEAITPAIL